MQRIASLDGLRGVLALVVLNYHVRLVSGTASALSGSLATYAVLCFFAISGLVLTKSYNGRYFSFLLRRVVRLWPVYAVCLGLGAIVQHRAPGLLILLWYPGFNITAAMPTLQVNPPAWSLCVEAMAMPFIPVLAWFGRGSIFRSLLIVPVWKIFTLIPGPLHWLVFFMIGASLSRFDFTFRLLETRIPQWLGKVSYSLYLSHMPMLMALVVAGGAPAVLFGFPIVFGTAIVVWRYVEQPSIVLSRRVGRTDLSARSIHSWFAARARL